MKRIQDLSRYLKTLIVSIPLIIAAVLFSANVFLDVLKLKSDIDIQRTAYIERTKSNLETDVKSLAHVISFMIVTMSDKSIIEQQSAVISLLEGMSTKDKGYYFVTDYDGNVKLGPATGKNMIDIKDKNGLFVVRELIKTAKAGGGFVTYVMPPIDASIVAPKISYVTGLDDWRWYFGAGVLLIDLDTINKDLTRRMIVNTKNKVAVLLLLTILFSLFVTFFNRKTSRNIQENIDRLTGYLKAAATGRTAISLDSFNIREIKTIATFAAGMIEQRNQSEEFRKRIFESSHIPIVVMDGTTKLFMDCNPAAVEMYHVASKDDVLGKSPLDFSAPVQYDGILSATKAAYYIDLAMTRGSVVFEWRHQYPDGRFWDAEVHLLSFDVDGGKLLQFSNVDITERKQAEAALKESNDKLNALFDAMTEMVVLHDVIFDESGVPVNYRLVDCNQAFTDVTGVTREAAVGNLADAVYGTEEPPYLEEFTRVGITGKPYHYETYFAPMEKHFSISVVSPGPNKFATITTDITAIKQIQQVIENKNKELEQIVYVTSHDLRSPLVNVDGYTRELEYSIAGLKKAMEPAGEPEGVAKAALAAELPDMEKATSYIRASTRQMDNLLKGLLKLSRLGRSALDIAALDMNDLVARVRASYEYQIKTLDAQIIIGDLPACKGDAVQVTQVFSNLVGNALKYADPGRKPSVSISGRVERNKTEYIVEDNGIGIAAEYQNIIFELFHRLDPKGTEGEGIGLTLVKTILARLDGSVRLESTLGKGSRFIITLPYAREKKNG